MAATIAGSARGIFAALFRTEAKQEAKQEARQERGAVILSRRRLVLSSEYTAESFAEVLRGYLVTEGSGGHVKN